jgi:hypothetical protein
MGKISNLIKSSLKSGSRRQRGFTLVTMAVASTALVGALGLAVDLGRMFIIKNETQAYCDSGALAGAMLLDGTSTGITNAKLAVEGSANKWNFFSSGITSHTTKFSTTATGTFIATPSPATGYLYVQVTSTVSMPLYFMGLVVSQTSQTVNASAVAGQVSITNFTQGLAPYTAVSTNSTGPNFGLTVGDEIDIQWPQYNSTRNGCSTTNPDKCFNQPTCANESKASEAAVVTSWGSNINGYWGGSANSTIEQEILDVIQLQALSVGTNITPSLSNGNKAAEANYLDERSAQDTDITDNTVSAYLAATHNGRRLIPVPIVNPSSPTETDVIGYGQFLLYSNSTNNYYAKDTNGNDPFCAVYAGPYNVGGIGPGAGGSTGATLVKLVQ